jgi:hypothetical protein
LPDEWRDKKYEAELAKDHKAQKINESIAQLKKNLEAKANDSDEDDLLGWNK